MTNSNKQNNFTQNSKHISKKYANKPRNRYFHSKDLYKTLISIETQLKKQNSFWRNFAIAVVKGLGNAIGATIIFGALLLTAKKVLAPQLQEITTYIKTIVDIKK